MDVITRCSHDVRAHLLTPGYMSAGDAAYSHFCVGVLSPFCSMLAVLAVYGSQTFTKTDLARRGFRYSAPSGTHFLEQ